VFLLIYIFVEICPVVVISPEEKTCSPYRSYVVDEFLKQKLTLFLVIVLEDETWREEVEIFYVFWTLAHYSPLILSNSGQ
jgi:hypothetical protein